MDIETSILNLTNDITTRNEEEACLRQDLEMQISRIKDFLDKMVHQKHFEIQQYKNDTIAIDSVRNIEIHVPEAFLSGIESGIEQEVNTATDFTDVKSFSLKIILIFSSFFFE